MEFKDQQPMTDEELSALLRKWNVDGAPASLETSVFPARRRSMLLPAIACACAIVLFGGWWLMRPRPAARVPVAATVAIQPQAAPRETPVVLEGPPKAQPEETIPGSYGPAHVDFFSDPFVDSGRASSLAAKPAPEPAPQQTPLRSLDDARLPAGVYRPGNGVSPPSVLKKLDPEYSEEARIARLFGPAVLQLVVEEDGAGRNINVTQPIGLGLDEKAIEAIRAWAFKPGSKDGAAVPVLAIIQVNFRLENAGAQPWHLTRGLFHPSAGAIRPVLLQATYPPDAGSLDTDSVRVSFDVDENGVPINFHGENASNPRLDAEAIGILSGWRFRPGTSEGKPVSTPATFDFAHVASTGPATVTSIRVGGNIAAGNLIDRITPVYPPEAKEARIQGRVSLQVHIGKDGHVVSVSVITGDPMLSPAALEAVRQWVYRPTLLNGNPVEVDTRVDINFTLAQ